MRFVPRAAAVAILAVSALAAGSAPAPAGHHVADLNVTDETLVRGELQAAVRLPKGYDAKEEHPVLYLLHGFGEGRDRWLAPTRGDADAIAKDFPGIIVMPDQRDGWSIDWYKPRPDDAPIGRGPEQWMRHWIDVMIPAVEKAYRIRPGRRWHAIAGASMGGFGAVSVAAQRPDYFGSVATFSAPLRIDRPEVPVLLAAMGQSHDELFGPIGGAYASGHNPIENIGNLEHTRMLALVGNGVPRTVEAGTDYPLDRVFLGVLGAPLEAWINRLNLEYADVADDAPVQFELRVRTGVHDWPDMRAHFAEALEWGMFGRVPGAPDAWSFRTARQTGRAWHVRYAFHEPLDRVAVFRYGDGMLHGEGAGDVAVRAPGCNFSASLPFSRRCPAGGDRD